MKKLTGSFQCTLTCLALATCALLLTAVSAWAVRVDYPGVSCQAYNNNQANALERSHVRLLNPLSSGRSLWVVCGMNRDTDMNTAAVESGWVGGFFEAGSVGDITCVYRRFLPGTVHVPGGDADAGNTLETATITLTNTSGPSNNGYDETFTTATSTATTLANIFSMTCLLPAGTGLNMISWNHN